MDMLRRAVSRRIALALLAMPTGVALMDAAQQPAERALIAWSPDRALTWSLYLGRPDLSVGAAAMTVYRLSYEEECAGAAFTFRVVSFFESEKSWVGSAALAGGARSAQLLAHEQGHFDLSEVQARKIRRALRELSNPCGRSTEDRQAIVLRHIREDRETQARYDAETAFGSQVRGQTRWSMDIDRQLRSLAAFANATSF